MAVTKCISANAYKKKGDCATIAQAGNITDTAHNSSVTLARLAQNKLFNHVYAAVSAASSGNLGTIKPYGAGTFAYQAPNTEFIGKVIGKKVSGVANTLMVSGANYVNQRAWNKIQTTHTTFLDVVTWTASRDGQPVYTFTENDNSLDFLADHACLDVAELVIRTGSPLPSQKDYLARNSN